MATVNLSNYDRNTVPPANGMRIAIIVSEWNEEVTEALYEGAKETLLKHGVLPENIIKEYVPGTFELTFAAAYIKDKENPDAVIVLGCVIQGETRHFDFICNGVANGITELNINTDIPVIFGVLTTENQEQAKDRSGGKHGNKGDEAAITAIKMVAFKDKFTSF